MSEIRDLSTLKEWDYNKQLRAIKEPDFNRVIENLRFGQHTTILIRPDGTVLGGNNRLRGMIYLNKTKGTYTQVQCQILTYGQDDKGFYPIIDGATYEENGEKPYHFVSVEELEIAMSFSHNMRGAFYLEDEIANVMGNFPNINWQLFDAEFKEPINLKEIAERFSEAIEDKPPEPDPTNVISKRGQVFQLGIHKVICGDATNRDDMRALMGMDKAKVVFTSPPSMLYGGLYASYTDDLKSEEYIKFNMQVINLVKEYLDGYIFWNISYNKNSRWEFIEILHRIVRETGLRFLELIVWDKGHGMPITAKDMVTRQYEDVLLVGNDQNVQQELEMFALATNSKKAWFNKLTNQGITNYWRIVTGNTQIENNHACFPVGLPFKGIKLMSQKGDVILDPFGGSGTTLIAAQQLDRSCYMLEMDPVYCDVIRKRYAKFVGKEAEWIQITPVIAETQNNQPEQIPPEPEIQQPEQVSNQQVTE